MPPSEQQIQANILRRLKGRGVWAVKVIHASRNGTPDILACYQGVFLAIEVKTPTGRLSPIQKVQLQRIRDAGGMAVVATCWDDVNKLLS